MKVKELLKKVHPFDGQKTVIKYHNSEFDKQFKETMSRQNVLDMHSIYLDKTVCSFCIENGEITIYCK